MSLAATVEHDLRSAGVADVLADATSRAAHSSNASLYPVSPLLVVVRPRSVDEVATTLEVCRNRGVTTTR